MAKPGLPWPADLDAFVDRTVRMAGTGLVVESRVPDLVEVGLSDLLAALPPLLSPPR